MAERSGIMLCHPMEEKRYNKWNCDMVITQPKLDGERCRVIQEGPKVKLLSSSCEEIVSVPHINEYFENLIEDGYVIPELDGELYIHGEDFESIHSIVSRTVNLHPEFYHAQFHVFDVAIENCGQFSRLIKLNNLLNDIPGFGQSYSPIQKVPVEVANSFDEIYDNYNAFLSDGYEGIIIRHPAAYYLRKRSPYIMKFKPKKDDFYLVLGVQEEISKDGQPKGRVGAFVCEGSTGDTFTCGSGLTAEDRERYWGADLTGWLIHVQYQNITPGKGVPRFPVFMELIDPKKTLG